MLVQRYLYAVAASALPRFLNSHCSRGLVAIFAIITIIMATIVTLITYLIFVTDTTDGVCVKKIARCKFLQI